MVLPQGLWQSFLDPKDTNCHFPVPGNLRSGSHRKRWFGGLQSTSRHLLRCETWPLCPDMVGTCGEHPLLTANWGHEWDQENGRLSQLWSYVWNTHTRTHTELVCKELITFTRWSPGRSRAEKDPTPRKLAGESPRSWPQSLISPSQGPRSWHSHW